LFPLLARGLQITAFVINTVDRRMNGTQSEPHRDRKLSAAEAVETKLGKR